MIAQWIKDVVDEDIDPADLQGSLKTGTILCELVPSSGAGTFLRCADPLPFRFQTPFRVLPWVFSTNNSKVLTCAKSQAGGSRYLWKGPVSFSTRTL